jgi:hypothetical protein
MPPRLWSTCLAAAAPMPAKACGALRCALTHAFHSVGSIHLGLAQAEEYLQFKTSELCLSLVPSLLDSTM